jgi:hypothetical protein
LENNDTHNNQPIEPKPPCDVSLLPGDRVVTCHECAIHPHGLKVAFCPSCFEHLEHRNHQHGELTITTPGGFCDCGVRSAWRKHPTCSIHDPTPSHQDVLRTSRTSPLEDTNTHYDQSMERTDNGPQCGIRLKEGTRVVTCKECGTDSDGVECIFCLNCFEHS